MGLRPQHVNPSAAAREEGDFDLIEKPKIEKIVKNITPDGPMMRCFPSDEAARADALRRVAYVLMMLSSIA